MYEQIPEEIKKLPQWVCWQAVPDDTRPGKIKKLPVNPRTGGNAQSNNPETWAGFEIAAAAAGRFSGIGFMFAGGYFGVDIDGCEAELEEFRQGSSDNIAAEFIHTLGSYAEVSVSGQGLHIICRGALPPGGRRRKDVEMYETGRFFTMTGNSVSEYAEIADCTENIKPLHEKYIGGGSEPAKSQPVQLELSEAEIVERAKNSKQGQIFSDLYAGSWESYFPSQSEADMSFCNMLAFWCKKDRAMMDAVYRSSGLMRDKWTRRQSGSTYGNLTLEKAIQGCQNVYNPQQEREEYGITIGSKTRAKKKLYTFDDTGNAERFVDAYGGDVRYSEINKSWFYYDGRKWRQDVDGGVRRMIDAVVEDMRHDLELYTENPPEDVPIDEIEKQFMKHIKASRSNKGKTAMVNESKHRTPVTPDMFDRRTDLLNVTNGLLNLRTGELAPHDREKMITMIANAEYTDKIDAPMWSAFLQRIFAGDAELIRFIQKAVGYSITGSVQEDCAFFCYGSGRNGKSVFLDVLSYLLGDYAINIQPESLMVKNMAGSSSGDIARLKGARFVTSFEPNEGMKLNEGLIKQLTGGGRITASKKYENEVEFTPEFKLWMAMNHKPVVRGTDTGIWSRIRLIPFTVRIPDKEMDKNLRHKLKRELTGILKWAVDGCLLWQKEGLKPPECVVAATDGYRNEMDVIAGFLGECCEVGPGLRVETKALFKAYMEWARENNEYEMKRRIFDEKVMDKFERYVSHGKWCFKGLQLLPENIPYGVYINGG
ncbi:MAG: phage/plasmid primase, P4 family [Defluviitaleaceae bacterium]|nr:phage/plasmid primase, P4 family [Defluviitaleaceae bacterium]